MSIAEIFATHKVIKTDSLEYKELITKQSNEAFIDELQSEFELHSELE
jgi:hypothetical protein